MATRTCCSRTSSITPQSQSLEPGQQKTARQMSVRQNSSAWHNMRAQQQRAWQLRCDMPLHTTWCGSTAHTQWHAASASSASAARIHSRQRCHYIQGGPKISTFFSYALTSSNIDQFINLFHCQNKNKIVIVLSLKIPPHLKCVSTLPCKI